MFKRLCTPATGIATLALFVALGGTGYSADLLHASRGGEMTKAPALTAASEKQIAKAEAKAVFKSLISTAHVSFATSSTTATHAATADMATNATSATNAVNVTHAGSADTATHAGSADTATLAAASTAIASVTYEIDPSAGAETVQPCLANPCTAQDVESTPAIAVCPAGTVAIGGGGGSPDSGVELSGSYPIRFGPTAGPPNAWKIYVDNFLNTATTVDYYAICTAVKSVGS